MAPHVFLVEPSAVPDSRGIVALEGDVARHAAQVVRLRVCERVDLVDGVGRRLSGEVATVRRDRVDVMIVDVATDPPPSPRIVAVQALAKGDRGERAIEAMTEVGVDVVIPWSAERCVSRWVGDKAQRGVEKWRATARAAAKQARRSRLPEVVSLHSTQELEPWIAGATLAVCLDESSAHDLAAMAVPASGDIVLIVGPEGGVSDAERELLVGYGARPGRLGPSVMRTSTAGPVAAAVVLSRTPRWGSPA